MDDGKDVRAEVGKLDLGRDEEPQVVDHEGMVLLAQLQRPPDEGVARGKLPRGDAEAEHGERSAGSVMDSVAHLGAAKGLLSEIVVAGDELVPEFALSGAAHAGPPVQWTDLVEGRRGREQRRFGVRPEDDRPGPVLPTLRLRQGDQIVSVHGSRSTRACPRSYFERQCCGALAYADSGDDQIPSFTLTSVS